MNWIIEHGVEVAKVGLGGLIVGVAGFAALLAITLCVRAYRKAEPDSGIGGFAWQGLLFAFVLGLFAAAVFGMGKALELVVDGWAAVVGIVTAFFGGWLAYKGAIKVSSKGASVEGGGGQP